MKDEQQLVEEIARAIYAERPFCLASTATTFGHQVAQTFDWDGAPAYYQADIRQLATAALSILKPEIEAMREVVAEANNSMFGSLSFFLTTAKGEVVGAVGVTDPYDRHHLSKPIERLKGDSRAAWRALRQLESGLSNDALDTLRTALNGGPTNEQ